jgi:hypothetical protein
MGEVSMCEANEPAFPGLQTFERFNDERGAYEEYTLPAGGLTKRQYFAAVAMQGLTANSVPGQHHMPANLAQEAVQYADALIAELEKATR